jgi:hypothetical protein
MVPWNLLGHSISIDPLGLDNFSMGLGFINCCYDESKSNKDGERTHDKYVNANPFNLLSCMVTTMGIWFACAFDTLSITEKLFQALGKKDGSASHRYQKQLSQLSKRHKHIIKLHIRPAHANSHGFQQGGATHAMTGTTCPPPIPSVANWGEWSMGKVLDVY